MLHRTASVTVVMAFVATACARTNATLDEEAQAQLDQASADAKDAVAATETLEQSVALLDDRVTALEEGGGADPGLADDVAALEAAVTTLDGDVTALEDGVAGLTLRMAVVEGALPVTASAVVIDDKIAAGFLSTAPVDTVADGFSYVNQRIDVATIDLDELEGDVALVADASATQAAAIAAQNAIIADLTARLAALEDFQANQLEATIDARLAPLADEVAALADEAGHATILGVSATTSTGRFEYGGYAGVRAANAMCEGSFVDEPKAHLCTLDEAQRALSTGRVLDPTVSGVNTWTVSSATRAHGTENAFTDATSLSTSCYALLTDAADVATGTRVRVDLALPGAGVGGVDVAGDALVVEPNRPCDAIYPVLCCR